jgi:hypothetical protein
LVARFVSNEENPMVEVEFAMLIACVGILVAILALSELLK